LLEGLLGAVIGGGIVLLLNLLKTSGEKSVEHLLSRRMEEFKHQVREAERINQEKWDLKRQACLNALKIVHADWSHRGWSNSAGQPRKQAPPKIDEVRECTSRLVCSCESKLVAELYLQCLGVGGPYPGNTISKLRNEIRRALELGDPSDEQGSDWIAELDSLALLEKPKQKE